MKSLWVIVPTISNGSTEVAYEYWVSCPSEASASEEHQRRTFGLQRGGQLVTDSSAEIGPGLAGIRRMKRREEGLDDVGRE